MENTHRENIVHVSRGKKSSMRDKPWVISTVVLVILVVLLILVSVTNLTGKITGKTVSAKEAGANLVSFAMAQGLEAKVVKIEEEDGFYLVTLNLEGDEAPYYVTKDGKYLVPALYPLIDEEDVNETPNQNAQTQEIPKTSKPQVELFVMSHCPYGTQAEKGIIPALEVLDDSIDFNLRFVYYAMHPSQGEVEEQTIQYCIQKEQNSKLIPYLKCFLEEGKGDACLTQVKIDKTKLNSCVSKTDKEFKISENKDDQSKWLSGYYPLFNIDADLNALYNIGGSPTLVINGVVANSGRDPASYLDTICRAFSDSSVPKACGVQLSSTAYSPGFGYTAGTSTSAQC